MSSLTLLLLTSLLVASVLGGFPQVSEKKDCLSTCKMCGSNPMTRVVQHIDATYPICFFSDNKWHAFADLKMVIDIPFAQEVTISYSATVYVTSKNYFINRLIVDGREDRRFRQISSDAPHHTNSHL